MSQVNDFNVGDLVTPNYRGVQFGWPKGYEAEVVDISHHYVVLVKFITDEETIPFDGTTINNDRSYAIKPDYLKKVRVSKKSIDDAIKSIMSRP